MQQKSGFFGYKSCYEVKEGVGLQGDYVVNCFLGNSCGDWSAQNFYLGRRDLGQRKFGFLGFLGDIID